MDIGFIREFIPTEEQKEYLEHLFRIKIWYWNKLVETVTNDTKGKGSYKPMIYLADEISKSEPEEFVQYNANLRRGVAFAFSQSWKAFYKELEWAKEVQKKTGKFPKMQFQPPHTRETELGNHASVTFTSLGITNKLPTANARGSQTLHPKNLKLCEPLPISAKFYKTVCFSRHNGKYFISGTYESEQVTRVSGNGQIGLDMGIKTFATDNTGKEYKIPKRIFRIKVRISKLSRALSKKQEGSNNWKKVKAKLQKAYTRKTNIGKDFAEKLSTKLLESNKLIALETLNFTEWKKGQGKHSNNKLAASQAGYFVRRLDQKCKTYYPNSKVIMIDKWYKSTQICSSCGSVQPMKLSDRTYICPHCGLTLDRDHNAAINILTEALRTLSV